MLSHRGNFTFIFTLSATNDAHTSEVLMDAMLILLTTCN